MDLRGRAYWPLGGAEVARLLGVQAQTVHAWTSRGRLPAPDYIVHNKPAWRLDTIERWARETGRWPGRGVDLAELVPSHKSDPPRQK